MKTRSRSHLLMLTILCSVSQSYGNNTLSLPIDGDESHVSLPVPYTADELAAPPIGEIKKLYLRDIDACRVQLNKLIAGASVEEKSEPAFSMIQSCATALDKLAMSRRQTDLFPLVDWAVAILRASQATAPSDLVLQAANTIQFLNVPFIETMAAYITQQDGVIDAVNLARFVKIFACPGINIEPDWEAGPRPVGASGIMVLDAAAVVTLLELGAWQDAKSFLGAATDPAIFFSSFLSTGNGLPVLKSKYASARATIHAEFAELRHWISAQEAAEANP